MTRAHQVAKSKVLCGKEHRHVLIIDAKPAVPDATIDAKYRTSCTPSSLVLTSPTNTHTFYRCINPRSLEQALSPLLLRETLAWRQKLPKYFYS